MFKCRKNNNINKESNEKDNYDNYDFYKMPGTEKENEEFLNLTIDEDESEEDKYNNIIQDTLKSIITPINKSISNLKKFQINMKVKIIIKDYTKDDKILFRKNIQGIINDIYIDLIKFKDKIGIIVEHSITNDIGVYFESNDNNSENIYYFKDEHLKICNTIHIKDKIDDNKNKLRERKSKHRRKNTIEDLLKMNGFILRRCKKHIIYSRIKDGKKQTFTKSKTPSDWRANLNQVSTLKRIIEE